MHVLYIPEENFACASSKIMAHSVDCNKTISREHIHTHILIGTPYSEIGKRLAMSSSMKGNLEEKL